MPQSKIHKDQILMVPQNQLLMCLAREILSSFGSSSPAQRMSEEGGKKHDPSQKKRDLMGGGDEGERGVTNPH